MKLLFTLLLSFVCSCSIAQTSNAAINNIRNIVAQINNDTAYTIKKLDNEQFLEDMTDEGGQLTGYFKNGQLVKMTEWIGLSSCVNITDYYVHNGELVFTYARGSEFLYIDSLATFDRSKLNNTMECRFYFANRTLIKKILKGSTRCSGEPGAALAKSQLKEYLRYKKLFTKN